ncbi:hypothetical protein BBB39_15425 [Bordetella trematum]|uniref:Uncharacterized protein n=1 Tax=Bordetella trematum TaxID=123899 RepID=A0A157S757_9BORD|nr:hypothetical protein [Bordetella trematum]AZR94997.1 hypothetical protein BBB39_15425 [Bordetella trematum]SAI36957.1 Uncharacterised protein [Bordetella trematum]SAI66244.1 Uncharacterised protein [Bordetella trematum]SUV96695.1 Uncharacterised protein [Bordetella trematum]
MYSAHEQECRLHFDSNTKKDDQPSATLKLTYSTSNDVLSEFSPDLKASLYRRPHRGEGDMADNADPRLDDPGYLPCLKFPNMQNKVVLSEKVVGATVIVHHGIGGKSDLTMEECTVSKFRLDPQEGGTVVVSMEVDCVPTKEQAGELHMKQNQDVVVSIVPPSANDGQLQL